MGKPQVDQTISAIQLRDWLIEDTDVPFRLSNAAIDGDLDLCFTRIRRAIAIKECEFGGKVDVRNANFKATVSVTECLFQKPFNSGDRDFSHTTYDEDMVFNHCTFDDAAWFIGVQCEGSGSFQGCVFASEGLPEGSDVPETVDFNGAKFGKMLEMNRTSFSGAANFNALKCGIGAFFHDAQFKSKDPRWPVNFVASSFGMACELSRAAFHGAADFSGLSCGLALNLDLSKFMHANLPVSFASISTPYLTARGSLFCGPVYFVGMRCQNDAAFDPLVIETDVSPADAFSLGAISPALGAALAKNKIPLPDGVSIEYREGVWRIPSHGRVSYLLKSENELVRIVAPTSFEGRTDFSQSQFGWILNLNEAVFDGPADFNGVRCGGGGFFQNTRFNSSQERGDFRFGSYGLNLDFQGAECQGVIDLESCSIGSNLIISRATLHSGIDLTNVSMRRLTIGATLPLKSQQSMFRGCRFEVFEAPLTLADDKRSWEVLVDAQDPSNFTRDIYQMLERYYRSDGQVLEADRIYYAGRLAERKLARRRNSGVRWPRRKWLTDTVSKWLTGYGVHPFSQLLGWILFFVLLGVIVFWPDEALHQVKRQPVGGNAMPSEEVALVGEVGVSPEGGAVEGPTGATDPARQIQPEGGTSNEGTHTLGKFFVRFGYSLDELLPVVNLHLADQWRPANGWRRAYLAVHILVGWVLIPLLIGAFTGLLAKN